MKKPPLSVRRLAGYIRKRLKQAGSGFVSISLAEGSRVIQMAERTVSRAFNWLRAQSDEFKFRSCNKQGGKGRELLIAWGKTSIEPCATSRGKDRGIRNTFSPNDTGKPDQIFDGDFNPDSYIKPPPTDNNINTFGASNVNPANAGVDNCSNAPKNCSANRHKARGWFFARNWSQSSEMFLKLPPDVRFTVLRFLVDLWAMGGWKDDIAHFGERACFTIYTAICDGLPKNRVAYANGVMSNMSKDFRCDVNRTCHKAKNSALQGITLMMSPESTSLSLSIAKRFLNLVK